MKRKVFGERKPILLRLEPELRDRLDRILWHANRGRTIQSLCVAAIRHMVSRVEEVENGGNEFPPIPEAIEAIAKAPPPPPPPPPPDVHKRNGRAKK